MIVHRLIAIVVIAGACSSKATPPPPPPPPAAPSPKPQPVSLRLRNHRTTPIWVVNQSLCVPLPVRLEAKGGIEIPLDRQVRECVTARQGDCNFARACIGPGVIRLDGDQEVSVRWDGRSAVEAILGANARCPGACVDRPAPPAGSYTLRADAYSQCTGPGCECAVTKPGDACARPAGLSGEPDLHTQAPLDIPSALGVGVVFE
jgi:hypothetical protein